jgi:hemerythrin
MSQSPDVRLDVAPLDAEHDHQLALLLALKDACAGDEKKRAAELVDQLDDYTNMHFLFEETLMIQTRYPSYNAHRREHEQLIRELRSLRGAVIEGPVEAVASAAGAIEQWLLQHIQTFDRPFAAFVRTAGR